MARSLVIASAAAALLTLGAPVGAHHSVNAQFDAQKQFSITGVLVKVDNINPHSWWHVDVKGPDGKVQSWRLESLSPNGLIRQGVKVKTDLRVGGTYTFRISPAWSDPDPGFRTGFMRAITINGKEFVLADV